ncbi:MAG: hypothetical protein OXC40_03410, partial [Proteobacteria bacterium]|nr:hypothetical protein [Pseudomonadota bacterium]
MKAKKTPTDPRSVTSVPVRILLLADQSQNMLPSNDQIHTVIMALGKIFKEKYRTADIRITVMSSFHKDKLEKTKEMKGLGVSVNTTHIHSANIFATARRLLEGTNKTNTFYNYFSHESNNIIAVMTEGVNSHDQGKIEIPQLENDVITWLKTSHDSSLKSLLFYGFLNKAFDNLRPFPKTSYHTLAHSLGGKPEEQLFDVMRACEG